MSPYERLAHAADDFAGRFGEDGVAAWKQYAALAEVDGIFDGLSANDAKIAAAWMFFDFGDKQPDGAERMATRIELLCSPEHTLRDDVGFTVDDEQALGAALAGAVELMLPRLADQLEQ